MSTLKNVANKLFKVELESHKVELALTDDLKITLSSLKDQIFVDDEVYSKSVKISSDLELLKKQAAERLADNDKVVQASFKKIQLAEKFIAQAERVSKELGIDVNTLPNYSDVIDAKNKVQDNIKRLSSVQNKLK
jgi:hypothetical protein